MKKLLIFLFSVMCSSIIADASNVAISVYIPPETSELLTGKSTRLLENKMQAIIKGGGAFSSLDSRYILVPEISIVEDITTSTYPVKKIVEICITYYIGDGVNGLLINTESINYKGIGENNEMAIHHALSKIKPSEDKLRSLIEVSEKRIIAYYNGKGQTILNDSKNAATSQNYEKAISLLLSIPMGCNYYDKAQELISSYAEQIITRNNRVWLNKAKAAWNSNPDYSGAKEAERCIGMLVMNSREIQNEVNDLITTINIGMKKNKQIQKEIELKRIESEKEIIIAKTEANASVMYY